MGDAQRHTGERSAIENNWATSKTGRRVQSFEAVPQSSAIRSQYYSSGEYTFPAAITVSPGTKLESEPPQKI